MLQQAISASSSLGLLPRLGLDDRDLSYGLIAGSDVWHRQPRLIDNAFAVSLLAVAGPTGAIEHSVDLARHDEIVVVQFLIFLVLSETVA